MMHQAITPQPMNWLFLLTDVALDTACFLRAASRTGPDGANRKLALP